ncbi:MAG: hypothetical protein ACKOAH_08255, partial [Pirellula sp.]
LGGSLALPTRIFTMHLEVKGVYRFVVLLFAQLKINAVILASYHSDSKLLFAYHSWRRSKKH